MLTDKDLIIKQLLGGQTVKIFDYLSIIDHLCLQQGGQRAQAQQALERARAESTTGVGCGSARILDWRTEFVLQSIRSKLVKQLREGAEQLEIIDTFLLSEAAHSRNECITIDDVINSAIESSVMEKPREWAVLLMLCSERGVQLTAQQLITKLQKYGAQDHVKLPSRQNLQGGIVFYKKSEHYPNWPKNTKKEQRFADIAAFLHPLVAKITK